MKDKYALRRVMLLKLSEEKQELKYVIKGLNENLQNLIKNEQTIRHASKEAIDKLLEDPKFKDEYDKFVESMKEIEDVERRKSEERSEPSDSSSEQSIDEAEVVGG